MTSVCLHRPGDLGGKASARRPLSPEGITRSKKTLGGTRGQNTGAGGVLIRHCYFFHCFLSLAALAGSIKTHGNEEGAGKESGRGQ